MFPSSPTDRIFAQAVACHKQRRLSEAERLYRQVLAQSPRYVQAFGMLASLLDQMGRFADAVQPLRDLVAISPTNPGVFNDLGNALRRCDQLEESIQAYRQAIALAPSFAIAHANLAHALRSNGQNDEAIASFGRAIHYQPDFAAAMLDLGLLLIERRRYGEAISPLSRAVSLNPTLVKAHAGVGVALGEEGKIDQAIISLQTALQLDPNYYDARYNLGVVFVKGERIDEAVESFEMAVALRPDSVAAMNNLSKAYADQGRIEESIRLLEQILRIPTITADVHSSCLFGIHYLPDLTPQRVYEECREWNQRYCAPLRPAIRPHLNDRSPQRRLKIGYVSADFNNHPVGRFLLPVLREHDRAAFEVFGYVICSRRDEATEVLRANIDHWRDITYLSDDEVAEQIRSDGIDVLIDLSWHTVDNRLLVFARKPAPVQVTYLALCSTTGLDTIDYRLTDPLMDPPGMLDHFYTERSVHLPEIYWCYPADTYAPPIGPPPSATNGFITFGCLNNFIKSNVPTWTCWSEILRDVSDSRLLLSVPEGPGRQRLKEFFEGKGIAPQRLIFSDRVSFREYLELYRRIDITLDTFPYAGGTTTFDALWMGVPVVSRTGLTAISRAGLSILSNVGYPDLVAADWEGYRRIALALAADSHRLAAVSASLRPRLLASPATEAPRFVRNIEAAYRTMWREWCNQQPAETVRP